MKLKKVRDIVEVTGTIRIQHITVSNCDVIYESDDGLNNIPQDLLNTELSCIYSTEEEGLPCVVFEVV